MTKYKLPDIGTMYHHSNGNTYKVIGVSNIGSNRRKYPPTVIYKDVNTSDIWSRPIWRWSSMKAETLLKRPSGMSIEYGWPKIFPVKSVLKRMFRYIS